MRWNARSKALETAILILVVLTSATSPAALAPRKPTLRLTQAEYLDRVRAIWSAQMIGQITGLLFEHKTASVVAVQPLVKARGFAEPDDDYYYEMVAIRAFEKYGIDMTVQQLGRQWLENNAGTWGSSEQALLLLKRGIQPPDTGSPRYNKLWWTIGPQFSSDVYGALAPGMPNVAAEMARRLGHINGYAVGADGAVFVSGMISLGFVESDTHQIVRKAAALISPLSPYRQCLDQVIALAVSGMQPEEIARRIDARWGIEYPATNNAVLNGGIVALSVWFGNGDFVTTENLAFRGADYTDTDCNAANAGSVVAAMHGMSALPAADVAALGDRVRGGKMGDLALTPPVDESISALAQRTAAIGTKILAAHGARVSDAQLEIPIEQPITQPAELFSINDLTTFWNPDWTLDRAGYGGAGGGLANLRGSTFLEGDTLSIFPRDEVRGAVLSRSINVTEKSALSLEAGVDPAKAWQLQVYVNNTRILDRLIEAPPESKARLWQTIQLDLSAFQGQQVKVRMYDLVLVPPHLAGNSYWRNVRIAPR